MHTPDLRLSRLLQSAEVAMSSNILVVDVPMPERGGLPAFRQQLAQLWAGMAEHEGNLPLRVGLDIWLTNDESDDTGARTCGACNGPELSNSFSI